MRLKVGRWDCFTSNATAWSVLMREVAWMPVQAMAMVVTAFCYISEETQ